MLPKRHPRIDDTLRRPWFVLGGGGGFLLFLTDAALLVGALFITHNLLEGGGGGFIEECVLLSALWLLLIERQGGYSNGLMGAVSAPGGAVVILAGGGLSVTKAQVASLVFRDIPVSLWPNAAACLLAAGAMFTARWALGRYQDRGTPIWRVALAVGPHVGPLLDTVVAALRRPIEVAGVFRLEVGEALPRRRLPGLADLGVIGDVRAARRLHAFDDLIVLPPAGPEEASHMDVDDLISACEELDVGLYAPEGFFDDVMPPFETLRFFGVKLIRLADVSVHPVYSIVKRIADVGAALAGIVLFAPLWALIAAVIRSQGHGPILFVQTRVGLNGRTFRMLKFCTMFPDAEDRLHEVLDLDALDTPGFKMAGDPRVTPFGRFLRRTGLDEAPQLINVLRGEMSLVGPRPELPRFVARYTSRQRRRLKVVPGITGLQQVEARGVPLASALDFDLLYMKRMGFSMDVRILAQTVDTLARGCGVS